MAKMTKGLRKLLETDHRVTDISVEYDGVFIYTNSTEYCDDSGAGTFREDNATLAIKSFRERVMSRKDFDASNA